MRVKIQLTKLTNQWLATQSISPPGPTDINYILDRVGVTAREYLRREIEAAKYGQVIDLEININTLESQDINEEGPEGEGL